MSRPFYRYQAVDGVSLWTRSPYGYREAVDRVRGLRITGRPCAEVERVLVLPSGGHRYWRWRRGKWELFGSGKHIFEPTAADFAKWDQPQ